MTIVNVSFSLSPQSRVFGSAGLSICYVTDLPAILPDLSSFRTGRSEQGKSARDFPSLTGWVYGLQLCFGRHRPGCLDGFFSASFGARWGKQYRWTSTCCSLGMGGGTQSAKRVPFALASLFLWGLEDQSSLLFPVFWEKRVFPQH